MTTRTITLTGRPPVSVNTDNWPLIASASDGQWDGEYESQANRISKWFVGVRQHKDGRTIVYATYSHNTNWQNERDRQCKRGVLLASATPDDICAAIREVCSDMATSEDCTPDRWEVLANDCQADMPAESLE